MNSFGKNCPKHWRSILSLSTMPSSSNRSLSEWPVRFSCRQANWKMVAGFTLRGFLWAADGPAIVPHPAMKANYQRVKNCGKVAISVTLRAVRGCLESGPAMRSGFQSLETVARNCCFGSPANQDIVLRAAEPWNTISRLANGSLLTPTGAFRKWRSVICNRTYGVESSPSRRAFPRAQQLHEPRQ